MTASSENLALIGRDFDKMKASIVCLANDIHVMTQLPCTILLHRESICNIMSESWP